MSHEHFPINLLLTIDQVSELTGVHKQTLRNWERNYSLYIKPSRTPSNRRGYSWKTWSESKSSNI